jgi:DNA-binding NarL/FixJ family response regulator
MFSDGYEPQTSCASVRVIVAGDNALTRAGLRSILADEPGLRFVGEASDGPGAVFLAGSAQPDLVLMDVRPPGMDDVETIRTLKRVCPTTRVLILSMFDDAVMFLEAVKAGAVGFVLKTATEAALRTAIREALASDPLVDQCPAREVLLRLANAQPRARTAMAAPNDPLSAREREVLALVACGRTNSGISAELMITAHTVKTHVEHIVAKLHVRDRTQAAVRAIELGYIAMPTTR